MKYTKTFLLLASFFAALALSDPGFARGGHGGGHGGSHSGGHRGGHHFSRGASIGLFAGPVFLAPYHYYPYYPAVTNPPPVYVEKGSDGPVLSPEYWYYCSSAGAYYPDVQDCPGGWQPVPPRAQ
jgi:hypothetical protein